MDDVGFVPGLLIFLVFATVGAALVGLTRRHPAERKWQVGLFLLAYTVRYAFSIVIYQFGLVEVLKDEDASGWTGGVALYDIWNDQGLGLLDLPRALSYMFGTQQPGPAFLRHPHRGYYFMLGALFFVSDSPARLPAAALNGFFGALTAVFTFRTARELVSAPTAKRVGWWICFFPSMVVWSAMTLREPVIILLETLALYGCIRMKASRSKLKYLLISLLCTVLIFPFRFYATYLLGFAIVCVFCAPNLRDAGRPKRVLYTSLAVVMAPILLVLAFRQVPRELKLDQTSIDIKYVSIFRGNVARGGERYGGGSGVQSHFDMSSPSGFVLGTAFGAVHLLLAPFPWQLGGASLRMLLTLPELLFWWYLFFSAVVPGVYVSIRYRLSQTWVLILFVLMFGFIYSMMFGNLGLVFRQRSQLLPSLLIMGGIGREWRRARRALARARRETERSRAETTSPAMLRY